MADGVTSDETLIRVCKLFEESEDATRTARIDAERDRDYYDEKQWTETEANALKARNQPVITYNRIKRKVNSLMGLEKQTRKDPKAFPRNPHDEESANAATDAIRYVCDDCRWDDKRSSATSNLIIEGTGAVMVGVRKTRQGIDPDIRYIPWDRLFYDAHSAEFDFSDANYMGIVIWKDLDEAMAKFPDAKEALEATWASGKDSETYDDKPKHHLWSDFKRRRVRIVEMYYVEEGKWRFCLFTKAGFIVEPMDSPYLDEEGSPENPIKAVSLYVDRDNNRYGEVRTMIGPQDEINKRRSRALHLINERQVRVSPNVGKDANEIRKELSNPRGVFVGEQGDVEILPTNDMAAANLQLLQEAKAEIDLLGPNAALNGKNESDMSGRAIIAQQQGGMLEAATLMDRIRTLSLAVYRAVWCRVRQHWTAERWIRVTDDERNMRFVGLNRPITAIEAAAKQMGVTKDNFQQFEQERPEDAMRLAMFAQSPEGRQVVAQDNAVAELDVDISIDEGMDTPTIAAEQFQEMLKLAGTGMVQIPPDVLIEASNLRNKDKLLEMLKQPPSPEQQAQSELQMRGATAEVVKTEGEALKVHAEAANEQVKPLMEGFKLGSQPEPQPKAA